MRKEYKTLCVFIAILLCAYLSVGCSNLETEKETAKKDDSNSVSAEILDQLNLQESAKIVRVYVCKPLFAFGAGYRGIEEVCQEAEEDSEMYYWVRQGEVQYVYEKTSDGITRYDAEKSHVSPNALAEFLSHNAIRMVGENIRVINEWIVAGGIFSTTGNGWAQNESVVFYETDMGNYVYFCGGNKAAYLMPEAEFVERMTVALKYITEIGGSWGKYYPAAAYMRLSDNSERYNIESEKFRLGPDPAVIWLIAGGCVLVAGSVTAIALLRRKKKL